MHRLSHTYNKPLHTYIDASYIPIIEEHSNARPSHGPHLINQVSELLVVLLHPGGVLGVFPLPNEHAQIKYDSEYKARHGYLE